MNGHWRWIMVRRQRRRANKNRQWHGHNMDWHHPATIDVCLTGARTQTHAFHRRQGQRQQRTTATVNRIQQNARILWQVAVLFHIYNFNLLHLRLWCTDCVRWYYDWNGLIIFNFIFLSALFLVWFVHGQMGSRQPPQHTRCIDQQTNKRHWMKRCHRYFFFVFAVLLLWRL